jgi:hypothetical protein
MELQNSRCHAESEGGIMNWHVEEIGYINMDGLFIKTSPFVNIYDEESRIPIAKEVSLENAELIISSVEKCSNEQV